jgi:hypothetical protein
MPVRADGGGRPRGASKRKIPVVVDHEWIDAEVRRALASSTLKSSSAKKILVVSLRALLEEQERLRATAKSGVIAADEARQISSTATNIRKTMEALGLIVEREETIEL